MTLRARIPNFLYREGTLMSTLNNKAGQWHSPLASKRSRKSSPRISATAEIQMLERRVYLSAAPKAHHTQAVHLH